MALYRRIVIKLLLLPLSLTACAPNRHSGPKRGSPEAHKDSPAPGGAASWGPATAAAETASITDRPGILLPLTMLMNH
jgi:hypothetical protein